MGTTPERGPERDTSWLRTWDRIITEREAPGYVEPVDDFIPRQRPTRSYDTFGGVGDVDDEVNGWTPDYDAEPEPDDDLTPAAVAERERAAKDARNAEDRARRLRKWNLRVQNGAKPGGFKPGSKHAGG